MLNFILSELWPYLAGLAGVIAGLFYVRQSGKKAGRREAETKAREQRLKNIKEARNVENETSALDDDSVVRRLDEWVRERKR